jgi:hypothetical protein
MSRILEEAVSGSRLSLKVLEEEARVPYGTLRVWARGGVREPEPENIAKLIEAFRHRADVLRDYAAQLEREMWKQQERK